MSEPDDFPEDLAVLARRESLSPDEQRQLERHLALSATFRATFVLGKDFDRVAAVQPGDEALVSRFAMGALQSRKRRRNAPTLPSRRSSWLMVAAVCCFCGLAYGLKGVYWPASKVRTTAAATVNASSEPAASQCDATLQHTASKPDLPEKGEPENVLSSATVTTAERQPVRMPAQAAVHEGASPNSGAALLLRRANVARRSGDTEQAISLFRELQRTYAQSAEAVVSHVSLGKLLAARGATDAALGEFTAYLSRGGPLEEEALFGRAQALAVLGRAGEEKRTLRALIARFPRSVYADKAKERLVMLENASSP